MFHSTGRQTVYTGIYIHIVLLIFVEPFDNAVSDGGGIIIHVIIVKLYVFFVADKAHLDDQTCHICLFDNDVIVVTVKLCSGTDTTVIGDSDLFQIGQDGICDRMVLFGTGAVDPCFYTTGLGLAA